jgi:hypothetical protein
MNQGNIWQDEEGTSPGKKQSKISSIIIKDLPVLYPMAPFPKSDTDVLSPPPSIRYRPLVPQLYPKHSRAPRLSCIYQAPGMQALLVDIDAGHATRGSSDEFLPPDWSGGEGGKDVRY